MRCHQLGGTGLKASVLGLAVAVIVILRGHSLSAREIEAFAIKEHYGVSHPDQIIDFELNGKIDAANAHMIGAAGRACSTSTCKSLSIFRLRFRACF